MFRPLATVIDPYSAVRRRQFVRIAAASIAILLMMAAGWMLLMRRHLPDEHVRSFTSSVGRLTIISFDSERHLLVAGSAEGRVVYWNWPERTPNVLDRWSSQPLTSIAITRDGVLIAGSLRREVFGWSLEDNRLRELPDPGAVATAIGVRPGTVELGLGLSNGVLAVIAPENTRKIRSGHRGGIKSLTYDPEGKILVTGGSDGLLIWRDARSKKVTGVPQAHQTDIASLAFSADGMRLVSGDWNGVIAVWDTQTRKEILSWQQPDAVSGIVVRRESVITSSWDGKLRIWSWDSETVVKEIDTGRPVYALTAGEDRSTVFTVSATNDVDEWKITD